MKHGKENPALEQAIDCIEEEFGKEAVRIAFFKRLAGKKAVVVLPLKETIAETKKPNVAPASGKTAEQIASEIKAQVKETWSQDGTRKMNPAAFIREYYAAWLDEPEFSRSHIAHDSDLARAYAGWIRPDRHPEDSIWPEIEGKRREHRSHLAKMTAEERAAYDKQQNIKKQSTYRLRHYVK